MRYGDLTTGELATALERGTVPVLPTGSIEQHGPHLPASTDAAIAERLATELACRHEQRYLVLPTLAFGFSPHHMSFAGSITLSAETYLRVVVEIAASLYSHRAQLLLILNGHGGNIAPLKTAVGEVARRHGRSPVVITYWDLLVDDISRFFPPRSCGHACALETSLVLYLWPHLVRHEQVPQAASGELAPHMFEVAPIVEGVDYSHYAGNGVIGNPALATAEAGRQLFELLVERLETTLDHHLSR